MRDFISLEIIKGFVKRFFKLFLDNPQHILHHKCVARFELHLKANNKVLEMGRQTEITIFVLILI